MGALALLLLPFLIVPLLGVLVIRKVDQQERDHYRRTYRIHHPADLLADDVTAWIRSISGTLRARTPRLTGNPSVVFETWATTSGITHRLKVPWQHADYVVAQLRSLVPGIRVTPEEDFPHHIWKSSVEVGLTQTSRQLRIYDPAVTSASLLASVQALEEGEALLMQWVVAPSVPIHPPIYRQASSDRFSVRAVFSGNEANRDEVHDRRSKLEEPNVNAVLRVASVANTQGSADHLITRVRASLASTRSPSTRFKKRWVNKATLQRRIDLAITPLSFPMRLAANELTALLAWPIGNPNISGLPPRLARQLPASDLVPREGRVLGRSNFPGNERIVAMSHTDARKHVHIVGPTGVGKTTLLSSMMRYDVEAGYGVVLIESKGDLFHKALDIVPKSRMKEVIIFDVSDSRYPIGFNILNQGDPRVVVDELVALFDLLYRDARSVWAREVLYHGLRTLISDPNMSFVDLAPLLVPMTAEEVRWRDAVLRSVKDNELKNFWQRLDNQPRAAQDRITQPVMDRVWQLNARPELRNIIGQSVSSFQMTDVIRENKILLVNLSGLPKDTASLTGTLLINALWHAVKITPAAKENFLYLDEFQDFVNLPIDPSDLLAKSRSFGLGMILAHQHLGQLPSDLKSALSANARTKIVFQTTAEDARAMQRDFGNMVDENDFMHLGEYEVLARVATGGGVSPPLTMSTLKPANGYGLGLSIRDQSRSRYGRDAGKVEREITARRTVKSSPKTKRPMIGSADNTPL